ncbi:MAG: hypothetical protein K0V04_27070 [Deltaproteobacteria bacterium]|nr:hypothetical protein [Deltaproteobacteria bacterium]
MSLLSPLALTLPLAFSPYAVGSMQTSTAVQQQAEPAAEDAAAENGWDETEPAAEPAADPAAPAETAPPITTPVVTPTPAPSTGTIVKKPAPPPPDQNGMGLMIAAGAVGAVALGAGVGRAVIISKSCASPGDVAVDAAGSITDCLRDARTLVALTAVEWTANTGTYVLAPVAGMIRAQFDSSRYMYSGKPNHNGALLAGIGGGVLGIGLFTKIGLWAALPKRLSCPFDDNYGKCVRRKFAGYFIGTQLASTAIAAGAGLLSYGIFYNKERKAKERLFFRPDEVRVAPALGRNYSGVALTGRF